AVSADKPESGKPDSNAQYNFTDPESRIMKGPDGFVQAYNVQVAVDELQLIVGQAVTQETNDKKQLMPMITTIEQQSGDTPSQLLADAGYCSDVNLAVIADTDIDAYISTRKQKHGERPGPCPRGPLPKTATIVDRMSRKLHTKAGAAVYAARKGIVEPVIGQIKQARGFRQFLLRGFEKVQGEWSLVCTTHNILKLYRRQLKRLSGLVGASRKRNGAPRPTANGAPRQPAAPPTKPLLTPSWYNDLFPGSRRSPP